MKTTFSYHLILLTLTCFLVTVTLTLAAKDDANADNVKGGDAKVSIADDSQATKAEDAKADDSKAAKADDGNATKPNDDETGKAAAAARSPKDDEAKPGQADEGKAAKADSEPVIVDDEVPSATNDAAAVAAAPHLLLIGGNDGLDSVEVVNVDHSNVSLNTPPAYPMGVSAATGQWFRGAAVVCGGYRKPPAPAPIEYYNQCYWNNVTEGATWEEMGHMSTARRGAASVVVGDDKMWVTGGLTELNEITASTEVLVDGAWTKGTDLPKPLVEHCLVQIDNDTTLLAGGRSTDGGQLSSRYTWTYSWTTKQWTEQGFLSLARYKHACSAVPSTDAETGQPITLVGAVGGLSPAGGGPAGGDVGQLMQMELYDSKQKKWTLRNQPLPAVKQNVLSGAQMSVLEGRPVLTGGQSITDIHDYVFEYSTEFGFRLLGQRMSAKRHSHVSISVPGQASLATPPQDPNAPAALTSLPDILIVGADRNSVPASEVLSLSDKSPTVVPEFPLRLKEATGGLFSGKAVVCGGVEVASRVRSRTCRYWSVADGGDQWEEAPQLDKERSKAAAVVVGPEGQRKLWVLGGESNTAYERTTEIWDEAGLGGWREGRDMKYGLCGHCAVALNDDEVMVVGGRQWEEEEFQSRRAWIYSFSKDEWTSAASLNERRIDLSCNLYKTDDGKERVIVAGGNTGNSVMSDVSHIEMYDRELDQWTLTDLTVFGDRETGLYGANMLSLDNTGQNLVLIGGLDTMMNVYDSVYRYNLNFGFYDHGDRMASPRHHVVAVPLA